MSEAQTGILILTVVSIISAIFWHKNRRSYKQANINATFTTVILFQIMAFIHLGHLDPFFIIAIVISGFIALIISAIVGVVVK